jgi:hypothetical protein
MRTNAVPFLLSLLALLAGCDELGPQPRLSHAAAMRWCGPADGPATVIRLADEPVQSAEPLYPSVSIMILDGVSGIAGRTFSVTGDSAGATYITKPGQYAYASSGSVTITSVDSAKTVSGSASLRFQSRIVETQFTAPWIESLMLCN